MNQVNFGFEPGDAIIITGAASGIGRAAAVRAAEQGLRVSAWDLTGEALEETASTIRDFGGEVHTSVADVSDARAVDSALAGAHAQFGPVRYLFNNAGPASTAPLSFDDAIRICLGSVRQVTDSWAAQIPADASMVVTTSVAGNRVGTDTAWYATAKAGLMGYVRHLAAYRTDEFRSNGVAPGMTDTPRLKGFSDSEVGQRIAGRIPLHRLGTPDDIAFAALFLLSPMAAYVNGVFLPVDGGWTVTQ